MSSQAEADAKALLDRLHRAMNQHDREAFFSCFDPDYLGDSIPGRTVRVDDETPKDWTAIVAGTKDFHAELLHYEIEGDSVWAEWLWQGTRPDGTAFRERAVTVFGAAGGRIAWSGCIWKATKIPVRLDEVANQNANPPSLPDGS